MGNYKLGEGATPADKRSTPKQYFLGEQYAESGKWLFDSLSIYAEFPPLVPPIMAKASTQPRKKAGGFMVANDTNDDIVHPILRPDLDNGDKKMYEDIARDLGVDQSLKDWES